jgi:hypothetical protein
MKQTIIFIALVVVVIVASVMYFRTNSPLQKASAEEARGAYDKAAEYYLEALKDATKGLTLPDKNRARILTPDKWNAEVRRYLSWISVSYGDPSTRPASSILLKLRDACSHVQSVHYPTEDSVFVYAEEWQMAEDWDKAFFPPNTTLVKNQSAIVHQAINSGVSVIRIQALTSYSFTASLIDVGSWQRIEFTLAPEDEVSHLVRPNAEYLLVCSSMVEFPDGKIWHSPVNLIDFSSPEKSSVRTFILAGQVKRL